MRRQRNAGKHERPRGVVLKPFEARQFHELMPRSDAPGADRGDNEPADEKDQEGPGEPACPVEERNHKGRSMGRHDAIDVTSSELRDPTTPPPIARIEKQRAAATTLQSPGRPRRHYRNRVLRERSYNRRLRA